MPLATRYPFQPILITPDGAADTYVEVLEEIPSMPSDGWDSLKLKIWILDVAQTSTANAIAAYYPRGMQLDGLNMWVTDCGGRMVAGGAFLLDIDARGILSSRGYKIATSAAVAAQSAENVITPPYPPGVLRPKVEIAENQVTCDVSYISLGLAPRTVLTGRPATPPSAPAVPDSWWDWLADPTYHDPNGWVLMASDGEGLPGVSHDDICLVTDRYQYIHPLSP